MKLTEEQQAIINSTGNIKINAVAGSGKTTTVIEYAKAQPRDKKILYLAFNKSVKLEAARKFAAQGLVNVKVETAHSLAYRHVVFQNNYTVRNQGYRTHEIVDILKLQKHREKHTEFILANHINKCITYFCNSNAMQIRDTDYLDTISDNKAKAFANSHYDYIIRKSALLIDMMENGKIDITHDFYLKKFQLSKPVLKYDYILFDEGQDASAAMLDIFLQQKATKVIVGDTHQQIYGWRFAVNSLEKADFKTYYLSKSFRFGQDVADLAMRILDYKRNLGGYEAIKVSGCGSNNSICKTRAILARTNFGLLLKAIAHVKENKSGRIYFEGNITSYTYADDGTSLYDILNLYNNKRWLIKDKMIKTLHDFAELEDFIEKAEESQLGMMVDIVKDYGNEIPALLREIKARHIDSDEKEKAELIFSTVHRCKGMEYDSVQLANDFITEDALIRQKADDKNGIYMQKLREEVNLLYVAVTRAKNEINIPDTISPPGFSATSTVKIFKDKTDLRNDPVIREGEKYPRFTDEFRYKSQRQRFNSREKGKKPQTSVYQPWTEDEDEELDLLLRDGTDMDTIMNHFGRSRGAISSRIAKHQNS